MGKKRLNKEEQVADVKAKLAEARAKRLALSEKAQPKQDDTDVKQAFHSYWAKNRSQYGKDKDFADILWLHLKSAGFDKPELFGRGIEHFGLQKAKQSLK